jgi:two-component system response regulator DesR
MIPDRPAEDPQSPHPVRLLLAEDQVMIREALAALLSFEGDIEVVAQVGRGDEVVKARRLPTRTWRCWTSRCRA